MRQTSKMYVRYVLAFYDIDINLIYTRVNEQTNERMSIEQASKNTLSRTKPQRKQQI